MRKRVRRAPRRATMRLALTLLVIVEFCLISAATWGVLALLHRYFDISFNISEGLWVLLISIVISGAVTNFLSRWIFEPITRLEAAMQQVANGDFDIRLDENHRFREVRRLYANFNVMVSELRATEILQTDFVSNVSHEFKTPINAIEGYATLLQADESQPAAERARYVDKILFNTRRLSSLVGNILLLSRVDNQTIQKDQRTYRLDEQIRQSIVSLEPEWEKKALSFDVELARIEYYGNEKLLLHVWNNLLENAVKFSPQSGQIRMRLYRDEDRRVLFEIEDQGPGIRTADMQHIFDRFYQGDSSHKAEGNGLGLALVKQILKQTNSEIHVENLSRCGCRFSVVLRGG